MKNIIYVVIATFAMTVSSAYADSHQSEHDDHQYYHDCICDHKDGDKCTSAEKCIECQNCKDGCDKCPKCKGHKNCQMHDKQPMHKDCSCKDCKSGCHKCEACKNGCENCKGCKTCKHCQKHAHKCGKENKTASSSDQKMKMTCHSS